MKFTKKEICGMYTVAQATEIASQFEDDTEWDFWPCQGNSTSGIGKRVLTGFSQARKGIQRTAAV